MGIWAVEFVIAFIVGLIAKRALWRILAWLVIPIPVPVFFVGPHLGERGEAGGWAFLGFISLLGGGFVATGIGGLLGYYVSRMPPPK